MSLAMSQAAEAARYIDEAHRTRARYQNLPEAIAPRTIAEAYAAQAALCELWGPRLGPIAGLKIATTTKVMQELMGIDHPCMGTIFAARVYASPAIIAKADFINVRIECELAVRLGRDLPQADAPYTRESVRGAVGEAMAAFELIEDRFADYKSSKALSLIADNAWNGGIVVGPATPLPAGLDLDGISGSAEEQRQAGRHRPDRRSAGGLGVASQPGRRVRPANDGRHGGHHRQCHPHRGHRPRRAPRLRAPRDRSSSVDRHVKGSGHA